MGRDKVLGLSLAILLIGFAGAFCFRNEEFVENGLKLARAKILDEGIAQRPGPKPYVAEGKGEPTPSAKPTVTLEGIEAIEPAESPRTARQSRHDNSSKMPSVDTSPESVASSETSPTDQFVSAQKEPAAPEPASPTASPAATSTAGVEKPLELTIRPNSPAFDPPDSLLEDSTTWQHAPDGRDGCPAMTAREAEHSNPGASAAATGSMTYCVRRGDTLTKIAQHFLGDSNRYRAIFEANRDQLQTPNARLKVGMQLQIPGVRSRSKSSGSSALSQSRSARASNSADGSPRTRQVPARPVARTRELSNRQPREDSPSATPSIDEHQEPASGPRFVPATKGPFWRSGGESSSANPPIRDLSQRAPKAKGESGASDRAVNRKTDNPSDESRTPSPHKQEGDSSMMGSDGSE